MLRALTLNCTLKPTAREPRSSTARLLGELEAQWRPLDVEVQTLRIADLHILPGVTSDEGPGDDWPEVRRRIMAADILVIGTPIWLGQPSSLCKRVLERMDAFLSETDERTGHMPTYGKVAGVAVVGNEDGAHHVCAELFQALADVGFTVPASASTYWVGEAMGRQDYIALDRTPEKTAGTTRTLARLTAHLARLLQASPYPSLKQ
ncbi:flavodoxin family protein [Xenophilus sp. Marseille-Q4582]|uniref:flavodoxin family protein n=1 Tax=Xenophilus sp. Marseille-Q4582 TaxID=2866600 RepID=UPI001CE4624C|nr:NAD(P)H-dependent oxidoreductase [Xenophilus sp. Marseille-Q4582]